MFSKIEKDYFCLSMKLSDEILMNRCLDLAYLGNGYVAPNPMVGCVIVYNDKIIGEGYHAKYGSDHAEVMAIKSVKDSSLLKDATLYVSLRFWHAYIKIQNGRLTLRALVFTVSAVILTCMWIWLMIQAFIS